MGAHGDRLEAFFPDDQFGAALMNATVIPLHIPRIVREPDAPGWFVILGSFGWLFGSRSEAVRASRELAQEARQ
jgi:hypothetical protein